MDFVFRFALFWHFCHIGFFFHGLFDFCFLWDIFVSHLFVFIFYVLFFFEKKR